MEKKGEVPLARGSSDETFTCIACCTWYAFKGIQLHKKEISACDFEYFLTKYSKIFRTEKSRHFFCDQASWHTGKLIHDGKYGRSIMLNLPRSPFLNVIESYFSFVKDRFRRRPTNLSLEEEVLKIASIFGEFNSKNLAINYRRNMIRTLISVLEREFAGNDFMEEYLKL